ncbi:hypothetical protein CC80DRAFT_501221 [Byssothecium circinans]|uniref:N-acetyltransferase domain-containing protein n=1 Tax=Byssothecium circinans TaxID=147558 RepID=A0A6A5UIT4_9PLEO|nr:hypothetical protein CC80DRAFT_501221 [Byssothecium circinans]
MASQTAKNATFLVTLGSRGNESDDEEDDYFDEEDDEFPWLLPMDGTVVLPGGIHAGFCKAQLFKREEIPGDFYTSMEEPSHELSQLAFHLFDRYGHLKKDYREHDVKKGSGVWGRELDKGVILFFDDLRIVKEERRQGLARQLVLQMLAEARKTNPCFFAITAPGWINSEVNMESGGMSTKEKMELQDWHMDIAVQFWRSVGFRRIGSSSFFALAGSSDHPSHSLRAADDYDPPEAANITDLLSQDSLLNNCFEMKDLDFLDYLKNVFSSIPSDDPL